MNLVTIQDFSDKCECTYEAIRIQIDKTIIPTTRNPIMIDVEKYDFIIKYQQNKKKAK